MTGAGIGGKEMICLVNLTNCMSIKTMITVQTFLENR